MPPRETAKPLRIRSRSVGPLRFAKRGAMWEELKAMWDERNVRLSNAQNPKNRNRQIH
jgi:hypothetical protein